MQAGFRSGIVFSLLFSIVGLGTHAASGNIPLSLSSTNSFSDGLRISVLTCGTGSELYTLFGHSAIRVVDSSRGLDLVFNYGTFDFSDPHFYWKFLRGKLLYFLSVEDFPSFYQEYAWDQRSVREQVLDLPPSVKQRIEEALFINAQPENRFYRYDFIFDNCTTRVRDLLKRAIDDHFQWHLRAHESISFRQALHPYLKRVPWVELGINLLLGSRADRLISGEEIMFLPDSLEWAISQASFSGHPLVQQQVVIYQPPRQANDDALVKPWMVMMLIGLWLVFYTWRANLFKPSVVIWMDQVCFFLIGCVGIFLAFMWWGTNHSMTKDNAQLIWASPLYVPFALWLNRHKRWVKIFAGIMALLTAAYLGAGWLFAQKPILALIPFLIGIFIRLMAIYREQAPYRIIHP
ncbi:Lnb N-terminal periplasmic domain-containing protein [Thermoflavifilum thermophilum]|uniref:Uncharacterized protein n=1 Tax=Thermoflavifilum thermophilum TaxID=1393122 RepID=A0A1I7N416_9BACT|nr:DUF4105 domain-containing protein [Thermoflavifilum thermophilum]SFV29391.1 protein of unknown function [Thermoflavifilum thermophilum]